MVADLELTINAHTDAPYTVTLTYTSPDAAAESELLAQPVPIALHPQQLPDPMDKPKDYGQALTAQLMPPAVREAFGRARTSTGSAPLRLRLRVPDVLAGLAWETLRDPGFGNPLFTSERVLLSRFVPSGDMRPIERKQADALRVLVAIANPSNLSDYSPDEPLASFEPEVALAQTSLQAAQVTTLDQQVTLPRLIEQVREGYDVLYLIAHGRVIYDVPHLWLEDQTGQAAPISASELLTALRDLSTPIPLVVLASCASAGTVAALAPQLAAAGAPAVLGMQGNVAMETLEQFLPVFFRELQRDGIIDRAVAAGRSAIRERNDWWLPVLYMRLKDGRLWRADEAVAAAPQISGSSNVQGDNYGVSTGVNTGTITQTNQNIHNNAPNQGAQGTFTGPVTFNQGGGTTFNQQGQQVGGKQYNAGGDMHIGGTQTQVSGDAVAGDKIDASRSQGFVNRPSGKVSQQFGTPEREDGEEE